MNFLNYRININSSIIILYFVLLSFFLIFLNVKLFYSNSDINIIFAECYGYVPREHSSNPFPTSRFYYLGELWTESFQGSFWNSLRSSL